MLLILLSKFEFKLIVFTVLLYFKNFTQLRINRRRDGKQMNRIQCPSFPFDSYSNRTILSFWINTVTELILYLDRFHYFQFSINVFQHCR